MVFSREKTKEGLKLTVLQEGAALRLNTLGWVTRFKALLSALGGPHNSGILFRDTARTSVTDSPR